MIRGFVYVMLYYAIFFCIAGLVSSQVDTYSQALGPDILIALLALLGGVVWLIALVIMFFLGKGSTMMKGMALAHIFVGFTIFGLFWIVSLFI